MKEGETMVVGVGERQMIEFRFEPGGEVESVLPLPALLAAPLNSRGFGPPLPPLPISTDANKAPSGVPNGAGETGRRPIPGESPQRGGVNRSEAHV